MQQDPSLQPPAPPPPAPPDGGSGSFVAPDGAATGELEEVNTIDDLIVTRSYELDGTEPPPSDLDDDDGSYLDDGSSMASEAMPDIADVPDFEPPAEDHSVQQLAIHTEPVFAVAVNPAQPEILATGGGDDVGYIWRAGQPQPAFKLEGHADTVSSLAFSADGSMLASAGLDGSVRVWHVATGALAAALDGPTQGINWVAWHTRGTVLLAGSEDATAWMWKLPEGSVRPPPLSLPPSLLRGLCGAPPRPRGPSPLFLSRLCGRRSDSRKHLADRCARCGKSRWQVMQIFSAHSASVSYGGFVNNGRSVLTASEDGSVRVWNPRTGTVEHCLWAGTAHEPRPVTCLAAHPSQPIFLFGNDLGGLKLAHAESGKLLASLPSHDASVEYTGFCDVLPLAASCGMDGKMCIWDLGSFAVRQILLRFPAIPLRLHLGHRLLRCARRCLLMAPDRV